jgi:hypothetical protein
VTSIHRCPDFREVPADVLAGELYQQRRTADAVDGALVPVGRSHDVGGWPVDGCRAPRERVVVPDDLLDLSSDPGSSVTRTPR